MRALKVLGLLVVAALVALLSGAAAGAGPTTAAVMAAAAAALPDRSASAPPAVVAAAPSSTVEPATTTPPTSTTTTAPEPTTTKPKPKPKPEATRRAESSAVAGTPCRATARACVDLSSNQAWLIEDGEVSYGPVPITHGRKGYRTPPGTFAVSFKDRDHVSSLYDDAPMPYSVFFNGDIAFHQGSLNQTSHGCIHLSRTAAKRFFGALSPGSTVQVAR